MHPSRNGRRLNQRRRCHGTRLIARAIRTPATLLDRLKPRSKTVKHARRGLNHDDAVPAAALAWLGDAESVSVEANLRLEDGLRAPGGRCRYDARVR